jgi:hypothetical protein
MTTIKDPDAGNAVAPDDISDDDQTLDWDVTRFGHMADQATDDEPQTIPAGTGVEEGN